jgi:hypothetical protein
MKADEAAACAVEREGRDGVRRVERFELRNRVRNLPDRKWDLLPPLPLANWTVRIGAMVVKLFGRHTPSLVSSANPSLRSGDGFRHTPYWGWERADLP